MIYRYHLLLLMPCLMIGTSRAQDTFSIVAADSTTREVGSAGASCVDLFQANISDPGFLGDLLPDTGAINTQAYYLPANQNAARAKMRSGLSPQQLIEWLAKNDVGDNAALRQYGVAGFSGPQASSAGFTGVNTDNYKAHRIGHIAGIHYSIQGNILLGPAIIDSMEARFRRESGDLACRLMAALQGAKVVGADTRCAPNGTSTLFAFVKVAQPSDTYGEPSLSLGVRTRNNQRIEPVDSLQVLFDATKNCLPLSFGEAVPASPVRLYPNPTTGSFTVETDPMQTDPLRISIVSPQGMTVLSQAMTGVRTTVNPGSLPKGIYAVMVDGEKGRMYTGTLVID